MRTALLFLALIAAPCGAQDADSVRADSAFRRRDWVATAELYGRIATRAPKQGLAWLRLGIARQGLGDLDPSITAFERALALQFQPATAVYRLARVHALKGNIDSAFSYLDQLVPMRAVPAAILDTVADLEKVRRDPRFRLVIQRVDSLRFPCRATPESRQFDFWIGDWDVTPFQAPPGPSAPLLGTNRIEAILEHCVLMENWAGGGPAPSAGTSMNYYDTSRKLWRQIWVADGGGSLDYAGSFRDGAMRFEGWTLAPNGSRILQKLTFFPIHRDTVRQLFETSADSGRTWQPGFDGRYTRRSR
jgi:hypothetical protein